ncbi:hypothetical protein EJB05_08871 [Eragrostis curvula]|uniref:Uncharacterized protein n=1 Tax=Eragrostis curvula TaxID=38414 RepID=A0A5J9W4N0_9POAL|nr:hypothetical protein EJB05_08871 [Eragrostis curvula]
MRLNLKKFKCLYQPFAHTTSGASELFHPVLQIVHQGICLYKRERVVTCEYIVLCVIELSSLLLGFGQPTVLYV